MKELKRLSFVVVTLLLSTMMAFAQKPNIHILATGGTIAGTGGSATSTNYTAGQVAISTLLDAVPELKDIANVTGEQIVRIASQDMSDEDQPTPETPGHRRYRYHSRNRYDGRDCLFPEPDRKK